MTTNRPLPAPDARTGSARALLLALFALLLAFPGLGAPGVPMPTAPTKARIVSVSAMPPLVAHFRDSNSAAHLLSQRLSTFRPADGTDGTPPPFPPSALPLDAAFLIAVFMRGAALIGTVAPLFALAGRVRSAGYARAPPAR